MQRVTALFISAAILLQTLWTPGHLLNEHHDQIAITQAHEHDLHHGHGDHQDESRPGQDHQEHPASDHDLSATLLRHVASVSVVADLPPVRKVYVSELRPKIEHAPKEEFRPPGEAETLVLQSRAPPSV